MPIHIYVAPAASGKTAYVLELVRDAAQGLRSIPRVAVPTHLQVRAWRRRLAEAGGAIGVRLFTFDRLVAEILGVAGEVFTELSEPVQYRLIRATMDDLPLIHYAPLISRPGFVQVLERVIRELKAGMIAPEAFASAVNAMNSEPRLQELAIAYTAYQGRLQAQGWADRTGLAWLAVEALAKRTPGAVRDWPLLVVDGFDDFTPVQLALLRSLADRVGKLVVTLTGAADGSERHLAHRRFNRTRVRLEETLGVPAAPLPTLGRRSPQPLPLAHLEANLFSSGADQVDGTGIIDLIQASDRAAEVRAALRWLKARLVEDEMRPGEIALLARTIPPYRPFVQQIAAEFGLPIRLIDGVPLRTNPAVAAVLDLLRLILPRSEGGKIAGGEDPEPALPRRRVVEAWRSPYFDWSALPEESAAEPIGIEPGDADALDAAARWGRVIGGLSQWEEVLSELAGIPGETMSQTAGDAMDEERGVPANVPVGPAAQALQGKFDRFVQRLVPPQGEHSYRDFVGWLETLLGSDPAFQSPRDLPLKEREPTALQVVTMARVAAEPIAERDVAALQALKDILRGLVWAEEAVGTPAVGFPRFFDELVGAVEATTYRLPIRSDRDEITVADVVQARGVPFRAVAVVGLAEGEFPATLSEDPFLRDADRQRLREEFDLPLEPSTESAEAEFFYETVTRPRDRLLLTRPRLADNGAAWQASPFWEQVRLLVNVEPETLTSESVPPPARAASWPELMESLAAHSGHGEVREWIGQEAPARQAALDAAASLFRLRSTGAHDSPFEGDLSGMADRFVQRLGPSYTWSASRLEAYRTCPFLFFVGSVLGLEPRQEPAEGLDVRQLGNIYHRILEGVYQAPTVSDPTDLAQLLEALPSVAARVLEQAPRREGFRETAWWVQTRQEIVEDVRRSLGALAELGDRFIPDRYEAAFGLFGHPPLVVHDMDEDDSFRLRGLIDRIDRTADGRLRVIDYKTGGPHAYGKKAVAEGKKLQLPLYALAARDALKLGEPAEGFYWHVRHAESSGFTLNGFEGGPEGAMETTVKHAWAAIRSARGGHFVPHPPDDGCPPYCPAVTFCWQYQPRFRG